MIKKIIKGLKEVFTYDRLELPAGVKIIFQLIYFVMTVVITLLLAPYINHKFEVSERKSVFYTSIINELNIDTKNLLGDLAILNKNNISKNKIEDIYINARSNTTKLHWRSVEFGIIFLEEDIATKIKDYQTKLADLERELDTDYESGKHQIDHDVVVAFAYSSANLLEALAKDADVELPASDE